MRYKRSGGSKSNFMDLRPIHCKVRRQQMGSILRGKLEWSYTCVNLRCLLASQWRCWIEMWIYPFEAPGRYLASDIILDHQCKRLSLNHGIGWDQCGSECSCRGGQRTEPCGTLSVRWSLRGGKMGRNQQMWLSRSNPWARKRWRVPCAGNTDLPCVEVQSSMLKIRAHKMDPCLSGAGERQINRWDYYESNSERPIRGQESAHRA